MLPFIIGVTLYLNATVGSATARHTEVVHSA